MLAGVRKANMAGDVFTGVYIYGDVPYVWTCIYGDMSWEKSVEVQV